MAAGIDTITVEAGKEYLPAKFAGVLKEFGATVIQLNDAKLNNVVVVDSRLNLQRVKPFWTAYARELAGKDLVVDYSRWILKKRGYENKLYRELDNEIKDRCWLLDKDGHFVGVYTAARRDYERIFPYLMGSDDESSSSFFLGGRGIRRSYSSWTNSDEVEQILDNEHLAAFMKDLSSHYDSFIKPLTKEEQKKRAWLGVEFASLNKETAKQMNLRRQTEDGRIGLMINRVYPNSPASKIGLTEGDILLKLSLAEAPWPIELKVRRDHDYDSPDFGNGDIPEEFQNMGYNMPRKRPWPSQDNYLNRLLKAIGEGTAVQLSYVHEGKILQKEFTIEQAPRIHSAPKNIKIKIWVLRLRT